MTPTYPHTEFKLRTFIATIEDAQGTHSMNIQATSFEDARRIANDQHPGANVINLHEVIP